MNDTDRALANIDAAINGYVTDDPTVSDDAMRSVPNPAHAGTDLVGADLTDFYGEVIHAYTRADAIRDGAQIEVPASLAREARIGVPVSLTSAAWNDCVTWADADTERTGAFQDETGRLWDVVWMGMSAARRARPTDSTPIPFTVYRIARHALPGPDGDVEPTPVRLVIVLGADIDGSPCITIMQPDED